MKVSELKIFNYTHSNPKVIQRQGVKMLTCYESFAPMSFYQHEGDAPGDCSPFEKEDVLKIINNLQLINPEFHLFKNGSAYLTFTNSILDALCKEAKQKLNIRNFAKIGWNYKVHDPSKTFWRNTLITNSEWDYSDSNNYFVRITEF